jgi:hypothetical protein
MDQDGADHGPVIYESGPDMARDRRANAKGRNWSADAKEVPGKKDNSGECSSHAELIGMTFVL